MKKTSLLLCEAAEVDTHEAQITAVLFTTTTASTAGLDLQHTPIDFSSLYYIRQLWRPYSLKKCLLKRGESSSNAGPVLPPPTTLFSTGIVVGGELKTCTLIITTIQYIWNLCGVTGGTSFFNEIASCCNFLLFSRNEDFFMNDLKFFDLLIDLCLDNSFASF